jgi:hypothetical protein
MNGLSGPGIVAPRRVEGVPCRAGCDSVAPQDGSAFSYLSPRLKRLLALLAKREWVWREEVDRLAGVSNGPELVRQLRGILGQEGVEMQRVRSLDRDGCVCRPGRYKLTELGRESVARLGLSVAEGVGHG